MIPSEKFVYNIWDEKKQRFIYINNRRKTKKRARLARAYHSAILKRSNVFVIYFKRLPTVRDHIPWLQK